LPIYEEVDEEMLEGVRMKVKSQLEFSKKNAAIEEYVKKLREKALIK
jgi:hypothetical protein